MAKVKSGLDSQISGKVGTTVYVQLKGKTVVRSLPRLKKDRRTPLQVQNQQRFKCINIFCRQFKYTVIPQIWNPACENMGYAWFLKQNTPAFDKEGILIDQAMVKLSCGKLILPPELQVHPKEGEPKMMEVSWQYETSITGLQRRDELLAISFGEGTYSDIISTGILRGHLQGSFSLPEEVAAATHLYLFFCSKDKRNYSESSCFAIN